MKVRGKEMIPYNAKVVKEASFHLFHFVERFRIQNKLSQKENKVEPSSKTSCQGRIMDTNDTVDISYEAKSVHQHLTKAIHEMLMWMQLRKLVLPFSKVTAMHIKW